MKIVIQIVDQASVEIQNEIFSQIGVGMLILLGIENGDNFETADKLIEKIVKMRTFANHELKKFFELSISEIQGEILVVSQFTIPATMFKGRRPDFSNAMPPSQAKSIYEYFVDKIGNDSGVNIQTGVFGAEMKVGLVNNGPITYFLDSKDYV